MFQRLWMVSAMTLLLAAGAQGADAPEGKYVLTLKNHAFSPLELAIPAHQKVTLTVKNEDAGTAEFESSDLDREKIVGGNSEIQVLVGPLDAGKYAFFDDFHRDTANGTLIVK